MLAKRTSLGGHRMIAGGGVRSDASTSNRAHRASHDLTLEKYTLTAKLNPKMVIRTQLSPQD